MSTGDKTPKNIIIRPKTGAYRAGLNFPVERIFRLVRTGVNAAEIDADGTVYLTAVLEYVTREILELAGDIANSTNTGVIYPRQIQMVINNDEDLSKVISHDIFSRPASE